jgi:hypothetical protein
VEQLVRVRRNFRQQFGETLSEYVEFFAEDRYLYHSSVAVNLLFGTSKRKDFSGPALSENPHFITFLEKAELKRPLMELGADLARQTVDILGNLPPDKVFFEQSPIAPEELDEFKVLAQQTRRQKASRIDTGGTAPTPRSGTALCARTSQDGLISQAAGTTHSGGAFAVQGTYQ